MTVKYRVFWLERGEYQSMECTTFEDTKLFSEICGIERYSWQRAEESGSGWETIRQYNPAKNTERGKIMTNYDEDYDGYANEAQRHCGAIERGFASSPLKEDCACHGSGWILSDYDTWHHCPIHFHGQEGPAEFEMRCAQEDWWDALSGSERHAEVVAMVRRKAAKVRELREEEKALQAELNDPNYIPF